MRMNGEAKEKLQSLQLNVLGSLMIDKLLILG